jgi:ketosteroid isomerase-like protein
MYTEDAPWQNPFGVRLHGKAQIENFLTQLFKRDSYRHGESDNHFRITEIAFRTPDVAVVRSEESMASASATI